MSRLRLEAAAKYKPARIRVLVVAEAPPAAPDRYFFFEKVRTADWLFRYVCKVLLGTPPARDQKAAALTALRDRGFFLIDLSEEPVYRRARLKQCVPDLVQRVQSLSPDCVILVKVNVFDLAFKPLRDAGLPVVDERIPFPASGQQRRFEKGFARALGSCPCA